MVQRWGEGKTYSGVLTQALLGEMSCWNDILPKKSKDEIEPLGACHEGQRKRASISQQVRVPRQTNKQNNLLFLVMGSGTASIDEPIVVGKYTQTRQRQLKAKMVKASHGRHYIKDPCRAQERRGVIVISGRESQENKQILRKKTKRKEMKNQKERIKNGEHRTTGMHQQVDPLSPFKGPVLCQQ